MMRSEVTGMGDSIFLKVVDSTKSKKDIGRDWLFIDEALSREEVQYEEKQF